MGIFWALARGNAPKPIDVSILIGRLKREKNMEGYMGSSKGEMRRRRENFAILGSLNDDFTRENGQIRVPKVAKIRTLAVPPLVFRKSGSKGGGGSHGRMS